MTYAKIDDHFDDNPKYVDYDAHEMGLLACGITYANRHLTNGIIPRGWVRRRFPEHGEKALESLLRDGRWALREDGNLEIVGFLDHNPSREAVLKQRSKQTSKRSEAGRKGGIKSGEARRFASSSGELLTVAEATVSVDKDSPSVSKQNGSKAEAKLPARSKQNEALSSPLLSDPIKKEERESAREDSVLNTTPRPMPADLPLTPSARASAEIMGLRDVEAEWVKYRAHQRQNNRLAVDWYAGWDKWCVDAKRFQSAERIRNRGREQTQVELTTVLPERAAKSEPSQSNQSGQSIADLTNLVIQARQVNK